MDSFEFNVPNTGTKIHGMSVIYTPTGTKPKKSYSIILIHAFPLDDTMWRELVDNRGVYAKFVNDYLIKIQFLVFSLPGFGKSTLLSNDPVDLTLYLECTKAVMNYFGIDHAIIGGCSMGGYISLAFAEKYPKNVQGLLLIDTRSEEDSEEGKKNRLNSHRMFTKALRDETVVVSSLKFGKLRLKDPFTQGFIESLFPKLVSAETLKTNHSIVKTIKEYFDSQPVKCIEHAQIAMAGRKNTNNVLSKLSIPILIAVGENDTLTPVSFSEHMHTLAQNSTLVVIPKAGHLSPIENPLAIANALLEWLKKVPQQIKV